jgi:hypothetical protein
VPNVQWKTPDDGHRNYPKNAEFLDKNKLGKISASVGFIKKSYECLLLQGYGLKSFIPVSIDFGGESKFNCTRVYGSGNNKCIPTSVLITQ